MPRDRIRFVSDESALSTYRYNTGIAQHLFCRECGVAPYYVPRSDPDKIDVNARCLEEVDLTALPVDHFDGQNWEQSVRESRRR